MVLETFSVFIIIPLISILFNQDLKNSSVYNFTEQLFNLDLSLIIGSTKEFVIIFLSIFFLKFLLSLTCKFHILKFATNSNKYLISIDEYNGDYIWCDVIKHHVRNAVISSEEKLSILANFGDFFYDCHKLLYQETIIELLNTYFT